MADFAPKNHMRIAFVLIVVLFAALAISLSGIVTGNVAANGGAWECVNVQCVKYDNVSWNDWAIKNCQIGQSGQGILCPLNVNGQTVDVPLATLMNSTEVQPQQCAELRCTKEIFARNSSYVIG